MDIIEIFSVIWYIILLVIATMIYVAIFKFFTKLGGRKKAAQLLGAPGVPIEKAMHRYHDSDEGFSRFIYKQKKKSDCIIDVNKKWVKSFFEVCHWCGFQVVIRKDSDSDIEESSSKAYDENILENLSKEFVTFNDKSIAQYNKSQKYIDDVKSKFEL